MGDIISFFIIIFSFIAIITFVLIKHIEWQFKRRKHDRRDYDALHLKIKITPTNEDINRIDLYSDRVNELVDEIISCSDLLYKNRDIINDMPIREAAAYAGIGKVNSDTLGLELWPIYYKDPIMQVRITNKEKEKMIKCLVRELKRNGVYETVVCNPEFGVFGFELLKTSFCYKTLEE